MLLQLVSLLSLHAAVLGQPRESTSAGVYAGAQVIALPSMQSSHFSFTAPPLPHHCPTITLRFTLRVHKCLVQFRPEYEY